MKVRKSTAVAAGVVALIFAVTVGVLFFAVNFGKQSATHRAGTVTATGYLLPAAV